VRASLRTKALIDELSDVRVRRFVRDATGEGGGRSAPA
jgi:hypothetical protein